MLSLWRIQTRIAAAAATVPSQLKLMVVMSGDRFVGLQHRSKLMALEALGEEEALGRFQDRGALAGVLGAAGSGGAGFRGVGGHGQILD